MTLQGNKYTFDVQLSGTIGNIKENIQDKIGILPEE